MHCTSNVTLQTDFFSDTHSILKCFFSFSRAVIVALSILDFLCTDSVSVLWFCKNKKNRPGSSFFFFFFFFFFFSSYVDTRGLLSLPSALYSPEKGQRGEHGTQKCILYFSSAIID